VLIEQITDGLTFKSVRNMVGYISAKVYRDNALLVVRSVISGRRKETGDEAACLEAISDLLSTEATFTTACGVVAFPLFRRRI